MKIIFHLDLDSYFVAAHRTIDSSLQNKPVVVSIGKNRSILTAVSYEAKSQGVKVGEPLFKARQKVNNLIVISPNFELYVHLSSKVFELISNHFSKKIEVGSIDEWYLDATMLIKKYRSIKAAAKSIQDKILKDLKLPVSIGIATNKFAAKMSTQLNKPLGITITKPQDFLKVFGSYSIQKFHGIGKGLTLRLQNENINTIFDLATATAKDLKHILGKNTHLYIQNANGKGSDEIDLSRNELKSIGNSITFQDYDKNNQLEILEIIANLCKLIEARAKNRNVVGNVVAVAIKVSGNKEIRAKSKQKTLSIPMQDYDDIYNEAKALFHNLWDGSTIKFVSVTLNKIENMFETSFQMEIGKEVKETKQKQIIKNVNNKFKNKVLYLGNEQLLKTNEKKNQTRYIESDKIIKHYDKKK